MKEDKKLNSLMTNNMTGLSRDQLREIINAAEEFLYRETNNEYSNELQEIWRDLELDIYTSLLLLFNDFNLEITVPGDMVRNNADSSYNNTFYWDVGINNFLDKDYNVFVKNRVINKMRIIFILFLIIILGATVVKIKYFKT